MATTKIFSRKRKGTQASASAAPGRVNAATFDSDGLAAVDNPSAYLAAYGDVGLAGTVHVEVVQDADGTAAESDTYTVPTGKQWRMLSFYCELNADSNPANRVVTVVTRNSADEAIETFSQATQVADATTRYSLVFEDDTQGLLRSEPTGTLTIAVQITAGDTMDINGKRITFVAVDGITAEGQIEIGATEAATKVNINKALGTTRAKGKHSIGETFFATLEVTAVDFTGGGANDNMVFTYAGPGSATGDGEALTTTEVFTGGTNVWGATTLGDTSAGAGAGTLEGSTRFPANGTMLEAGEDINISVVAGLAGDDLDYILTYIEYDVSVT